MCPRGAVPDGTDEVCDNHVSTTGPQVPTAAATENTTSSSNAAFKALGGNNFLFFKLDSVLSGIFMVFMSIAGASLVLW